MVKKDRVLVIECSPQNTYEGEPMLEGIHNLAHYLGYQVTKVSLSSAILFLNAVLLNL